MRILMLIIASQMVTACISQSDTDWLDLAPALSEGSAPLEPGIEEFSMNADPITFA